MVTSKSLVAGIRVNWDLFTIIVKSLSCVRLFATPWTVAYQAPLSMGFSRQEYWSRLPLPSPPVVMYGCESWTVKKAEH